MRLDDLVRIVAARAHVRPVAFVLEYELTHLCNLACLYCDRHTPSSSELELSEIIDILQQFTELGMRYTSLDGGEPLAHPHFAAIVDWLVEHGVTIHLNSNGILIPKHLDAIRKIRQLKVSLDGPSEVHDSMRGAGSFERAVCGIRLARQSGVSVELRCVLGSHNVTHVDALIDLVASWNLGLSIMFQPARTSLFGGVEGNLHWLVDRQRMHEAFARIETRKRAGAPVANRWGSLRHFRHFPQPHALPCAAGWIKVTMDPSGNLYHCGMTPRPPDAVNVKVHGVAAAFAALERKGCTECWCSSVVEVNQAWGGQWLQLLKPL
jgi:MoaA/NifB/PqqE/SkfB family radical SAM enzyme